MLKAVPAVGVALSDVTEKCVANCCCVVELLPHPLRSHKLQIAIKTNSDFFMTSPHVFAEFPANLPTHTCANPSKKPIIAKIFLLQARASPRSHSRHIGPLETRSATP